MSDFCKRQGARKDRGIFHQSQAVRLALAHLPSTRRPRPANCLCPVLLGDLLADDEVFLLALRPVLEWLLNEPILFKRLGKR